MFHDSIVSSFVLFNISDSLCIRTLIYNFTHFFSLHESKYIKILPHPCKSWTIIWNMRGNSNHICHIIRHQSNNHIHSYPYTIQNIQSVGYENKTMAHENQIRKIAQRITCAESLNGFDSETASWEINRCIEAENDDVIDWHYVERNRIRRRDMYRPSCRFKIFGRKNF